VPTSADRPATYFPSAAWRDWLREMTARREETRDRRMAQLVQDSAAGRLILSQRW
jgi:hypothetical protein